jgi:hypothetical protein
LIVLFLFHQFFDILFAYFYPFEVIVYIFNNLYSFFNSNPLFNSLFKLLYSRCFPSLKDKFHRIFINSFLMVSSLQNNNYLIIF